VPALPSWLTTPLWDQFAALLPEHGPYHPDHPLGCHRRRVADRVVFDKLAQVLVFGCGYRKIADAACSATTLRDRRNQWIAAGLFATLELLVLGAYDRMIGLELDDLAVDGCIKAPCGGDHAGRSPVDCGKQGRKRSTVTEARGIPLGTVAAGANRHDAPLLGPTLDTLDRLGPLPEAPTVHLDRGYDSAKSRAELAARGMTGQIAAKGTPAPIQASRR
jgi:transposase